MIEIKNAIKLIQNNKIDNVFYLKGEDQFLQNFQSLQLSIVTTVFLPHLQTIFHFLLNPKYLKYSW